MFYLRQNSLQEFVCHCLFPLRCVSYQALLGTAFTGYAFGDSCWRRELPLASIEGWGYVSTANIIRSACHEQRRCFEPGTSQHVRRYRLRSAHIFQEPLVNWLTHSLNLCFLSESSVAYLRQMTTQDSDFSVCRELILISMQYLWRVTCTSSVRDGICVWSAHSAMEHRRVNIHRLPKVVCVLERSSER